MPDLDRRITAWLDDRAVSHAPDDLLGHTLARTSRLHRRPAWRIPERWIPMTMTLRLAVVPRALIYLMLLALLIAMLAAGGLVVGSLRNATVIVPPPTGPARNGMIAYGYLGDIWLVDEHGEQPQQLTSGSDLDFPGAWSPDGASLAYWSASFSGDPTNTTLVETAGNDGGLSLKVIRPGDAEPHILASDLAFSGLGGVDITWSPDSTLVAYAHKDPADPSVPPRIDIAPMNGDPSWTLVSNGATPAWSPDGKTIAYQNGAYLTDPDGNSTSQYGISLIDASGGTPRPLSRVAGGDEWSFLDPQWSSDSQRVVFHAGTNFTDDIYVAQADGSGETRVTNNADTERFPVWSPDDERILYYRVSGSSGSSRLVTSHPDGGDELIYQDVPTAYRPVHWSPDGRLLLALTASNGLAILDAASGAPPVRVLSGLIGDPVWQRLVS